MSFIQTFQVYPYVPEKLKFLEELARNLWWCWNLDAIELFRRIDPKLWDLSGRNPIIFSTLIDQKRLEVLAKDDSFLSHQAQVKSFFDSQVHAKPIIDETTFNGEKPVVYFSMEFGIHECLPLFAGGLGVLAGDHLKAASDRGIDLVGVGLFYRNGYFHQYLNHEGWQQEEYPETDLYHLPIERAKDRSGKEIKISVSGPDGEIHLIVWKLMIGRVPLYLLDTNIMENAPEIRDINKRLYPANQKKRLAQEVILGIGGMKALDVMGLVPAVCHMNEGHCAFSSVERLAQVVSKYKVDIKTAVEIVSRATVFTTHTPVAAGHDEFPVDLVRPCLKPFQEKFDMPIEHVLAWGQPKGAAHDHPFSMFVLGLNLSQYRNGVSELHGKVARRMWSFVWPDCPEEEIPISHITNGTHIPSWISIENALLFERYLGPEWYLNTHNSDLSKRIDDIYDEELWRAHEMSRTRLIRSCRRLMVSQYGRRSASKSLMKEAETVLDQDALTIGFARRFATYKRANLLLHDPERFESILTSAEHPVQFIFSGKAHPRDNEGKELIKQIVQFARRPKLRHKIVFLEDYDINIARHLVQGADVWLNTPRRPFEACGTSGIKAAANGVLNVSVLDGWWCEGYTPERGWSIGNGEEYDDHMYQDAVESQALYNILENDVIPCFYERESGGIPVRWLKMMKASMRMALENFCAHSMVNTYEDRFYVPAAKRFNELIADDAREARRLTLAHEKLRTNWNKIRVERPIRELSGPFRVGETFNVTARVCLGELLPEEVKVELYFGKMKSIDALASGVTKLMTVKENLGEGTYLYTCPVICGVSGRFGLTVRVTPDGDDLIRFTPGLITWA